MALMERLEDIKAWQEACILVREIYQMSSTGSFAQDFALRDQIRSAVVSSMSNIAEGFDCDSKKESPVSWKLLAVRPSRYNHSYM